MAFATEYQGFTIAELYGEQLLEHLAELIALLQDAVNGGASLGFLPPLSVEKAHNYWLGLIPEMTDKSLILLGVLDGKTLVGSAQLALATKENASHRAEVQKIMVHTRMRRRGIAWALLDALDDIARRQGRSLLVLDTRRGDDAERLYARYGYQRAGIIPQFARSATGTLDDTVIFYRSLAV